jgi:hypothetical protein
VEDIFEKEVEREKSSDIEEPSTEKDNAFLGKYPYTLGYRW